MHVACVPQCAPRAAPAAHQSPTLPTRLVLLELLHVDVGEKVRQRGRGQHFLCWLFVWWERHVASIRSGGGGGRASGSSGVQRAVVQLAPWDAAPAATR
jgi:hypothetical protein